MKKKCKECGMIRSSKDLVLMEEDIYFCFSCWNKYLKNKNDKNQNDISNNSI